MKIKRVIAAQTFLISTVQRIRNSCAFCIITNQTGQNSFKVTEC
jgi:hypothetical protein